MTRIGKKRLHKHIPKKDLNTHPGFPEQRLILYYQKYSIEFKNNILLKSQFLPSKDLQFLYIDQDVEIIYIYKSYTITEMAGLAESTVCQIVVEVCKVIVEEL